MEYKLRISQILTNILSNAIKFTSIGEININVLGLSDDKVRFEVKDTGIGISSKKQQKLFKSFSQADSSTTRKYGGTGLGLAISKQLVELMNGNIWVESKKDVGSSFIFEIELPKSDFKCHNIRDENLNTYAINTLVDKRMLIVEDNKTNQLILLGLLENSKFEVDIANNGKEAIDMFNENNYDIILMDLQMPVMDGYTAAKTIREINKDIPIIALTANAMKSDIYKTKEAGMNEHLTKPLDVKKLFYTINKYIK